MMSQTGDLLRRPLYVFDLPQELLVTLYLKDPTILQPASEIDDTPTTSVFDGAKGSIDHDNRLSTHCQLCKASLSNTQEQRLHIKSDWHNFNLKQKLKGAKYVTENEFDKMVDDLDESISGTGSETSDAETDQEGSQRTTLSTLLRKQANLSNPIGEDKQFTPERRPRGAGKPPLLWFSTPLLPSNTSLGVYRALLTNSEQEHLDPMEVLRMKQFRPVPAKPLPVDGSNGVPLPSTMTSPSIFMCMIGGGHFAGMIVSLAPKLNKHSSGIEQRQAIVIAHKTFHRYTTRRKQGGAQSANDSAKGAAHSAGSSLRRYNEMALEQEIRSLLAEWKDLITNAQLVFVRATGSSNRHILFGPYDGQVLHANDPRNRTFPFSTRRATQAELMRAFVELTRVRISEVDEAALAAATAAAEAAQVTTQARSTSEQKPKASKQEEEAVFHTSQLQALIRRSKVPALLSYLSSHSLPTDYEFSPPSTQRNHHASTLLHLASSINSPPVVSALLIKASANPTFPNGEGKPAFDLAGDRATRDAFRVARSELGETRWDWSAAHVPPALSKSEAEKRDVREKAENEKAESERRKTEEDRLRRETPSVDSMSKRGGKTIAAMPKTADEKREEEARGMTPEMKVRIERERRARAAEERMKRFAGGNG